MRKLNKIKKQVPGGSIHRSDLEIEGEKTARAGRLRKLDKIKKQVPGRSSIRRNRVPVLITERALVQVLSLSVA